MAKISPTYFARSPVSILSATKFMLRLLSSGKRAASHCATGAASVLLEARDRRPLPPPSARCGRLAMADGQQEHEPDQGSRHTLCTHSSSPLIQRIADVRLPLAYPRAPPRCGRRSRGYDVARSGDRGRSSYRPVHPSYAPTGNAILVPAPAERANEQAPLGIQQDRRSGVWRRAPWCQGNGARGLAACPHVGTSRGVQAREGRAPSRAGVDEPQHAQVARQGGALHPQAHYRLRLLTDFNPPMVR
jgi:hypothetical protein